jgi:hypothetical protein
MVQTVLALLIVALVAGAMAWRALRPVLVKGGRESGCACGSDDGPCVLRGPASPGASG